MMKHIYKEIKYGLRNSRFLILMVSFLFFAILTPLMTKLVLPQILKSQFPGMAEQDMQGMLDMSQTGCLRSYMGDVFEIGSIIVAFTLCGLIAQEIKDNTLVLPLCSGKKLRDIIAAKLLVFGAVLVFALTAALIVDYIYSGLLFSFDIGFMTIIRGGLLQGLYMVFLLVCLMMWGAILKKPVAAGFLTLITSFGMHFIGSFLNIQEYLPSALLTEAQKLSAAPDPSLIKSLCITGGIIIAFSAITLIRLKRLEWNER